MERCWQPWIQYAFYTYIQYHLGVVEFRTVYAHPMLERSWISETLGL